MSISSRGLTLTSLYLLGAVTLASLLAWLLDGIIAVGYDKLLSRAVLLFLAIGLVPLWRGAGLSAGAIGLLPARLDTLPRALAVGLLVILPLMLFFYVVGFRVTDDRVVILSAEFVLLAAAIGLSAVLVGLFEEVLFRGLLYSALRKAGGFWGAACWVGVIYAGVHFLGQGNTLPAVADVHWYTGFLHVGAAVSGLSAPLLWWDSFVSLSALGIMLCWVRERVGLWWCIGLHVVWVFAIRLYKELTVRDVVNPYAAWTGEYDNFLGHAATAWLIFLAVVIALTESHRRNLGFWSRPEHDQHTA